MNPCLERGCVLELGHPSPHQDRMRGFWPAHEDESALAEVAAGALSCATCVHFEPPVDLQPAVCGALQSALAVVLRHERCPLHRRAPS
jgi:hypothetical protein